MTESVKAKYLTEKLRVPINENQILLSHTPYKSLIQRYKDCRILVILIYCIFIGYWSKRFIKGC